MKLFKRLPRWLRFPGLVFLVVLCVGINAIALVGISRSLKSRPSADSNLYKTTALKISPIQPAATANSNNKLDEQVSATNRAGKGNKLAPVTDDDLSKSPNSRFTKPAEPFISTTTQLDQTTSWTTSQATSINQQRTRQQSTAPQSVQNAQPRYGHRPYAAKDANALVQVASYPEGRSQRAEKMHPEAAKALLDMVAAARADGVWLVPASGFRTFAQQRTLFNAQVAKKGSPEAAAKISAPPGYSEHHTGYAIDLTDGNFPQNQDISPAFAATPTYQWLLKNAARYGFELSFPENNSQGISFEPWHWRYVGSPQARAIFGKNQPSETISGGTERLLE